MSKAFIDLFIEDAEAMLGNNDGHYAAVKLSNTNLFLKGATRKEAQAVADAINAAIEGAKMRAAIAAAPAPVETQIAAE